MSNSYDLHELGLGNCHIHTNYSVCARKEMSAESIINTAELNNLQSISLTDHHHLGNQDLLEHLHYLQNEVERIKSSITVNVGAELSAYGINKFSDSLTLNKQVGFRLYACNHYHLDFWEHPADTSPRGYAKHNLAVTKALIKSNRADCIAHPYVQKYLRNKFADITTITQAIKDAELKSLFKLSIKHNVAWEVNESLIAIDPCFIYRFWEIGRDIGAEFKFGTDAHALADINTESMKKKLKKLLQLP